MVERSRNSQSVGGVTQFGYLGIGVSNMDSWKEFAGNILGLQENGASADGGIFLRMDDYHHRFELLPTGEDDIVFHGWEAKDAAALEQIASNVRAFGIEVTRGTKEDAARRMVVDLIRFNDPDGIRTEVYYGPLIEHKTFVSPRGVQGFNANDLGFGHMVVAVEDPEAYIRFFTEALGARVSDFIELSLGTMKLHLTFLRVNPRHHSLAIVQRMKLPAGAPPQKRINHIMLELNSIDDVGYALGLFQQKGIPTGNLGRHTNDRMLSFYGQTPSGFNVEYGCNGLLIEDENKWEVRNYRAASFWGHGMPPTPAPPA